MMLRLIARRAPSSGEASVGEATEPLARSLPLPWRRRLVTAVAEAARCTLCCALLPDVGSARADADDCM